MICKTRLINFIRTIVQKENLIERARQNLAEQKLFEPYTSSIDPIIYSKNIIGFRRLDQSRQGGLRVDDIIDFLLDNSIPEENAQLIVDNLDFDKDGIITYNDFNKTILPRNNKNLKELVTLRDSYFIDVNMLLPYEVESALAKIFSTILNSIPQIQQEYKKLQEVLQANQLQIEDIMMLSEKSITPDNLKSLFTLQGEYISDEDIYLFFMFFDPNSVNKLSLEQFNCTFNSQLQKKVELPYQEYRLKDDNDREKRSLDVQSQQVNDLQKKYFRNTHQQTRSDVKPEKNLIYDFNNTHRLQQSYNNSSNCYQSNEKIPNKEQAKQFYQQMERDQNKNSSGIQYSQNQSKTIRFSDLAYDNNKEQNKPLNFQLDNFYNPSKLEYSNERRYLQNNNNQPQQIPSQKYYSQRNDDNKYLINSIQQTNSFYADDFNNQNQNSRFKQNEKQLYESPQPLTYNKNYKSYQQSDEKKPQEQRQNNHEYPARDRLQNKKKPQKEQKGQYIQSNSKVENYKSPTKQELLEQEIKEEIKLSRSLEKLRKLELEQRGYPYKYYYPYYYPLRYCEEIELWNKLHFLKEQEQYLQCQMKDESQDRLQRLQTESRILDEKLRTRLQESRDKSSTPERRAVRIFNKFFIQLAIQQQQKLE